MITMCMNVIKASFYMHNWSNVISYASKAEQAIESLESTLKSTTNSSNLSSMMNPMDISTTSSTSGIMASDMILTSRLKVYAGIAELATKRYKLAARHFLGVAFDHCSNYFQVSEREYSHVCREHRHMTMTETNVSYVHCNRHVLSCPYGSIVFILRNRSLKRQTTLFFLGSYFAANIDSICLSMQFSNIRTIRNSSFNSHVTQHETIS
jgi:hypothetical protein